METGLFSVTADMNCFLLCLSVPWFSTGLAVFFLKGQRVNTSGTATVRGSVEGVTWVLVSPFTGVSTVGGSGVRPAGRKACAGSVRTVRRAPLGCLPAILLSREGQQVPTSFLLWAQLSLAEFTVNKSRFL